MFSSGTGALAIFIKRYFEVNITTSDVDDEEVEENIAYNCKANEVKVFPHIRRKFCSVIKHKNDICFFNPFR